MVVIVYAQRFSKQNLAVRIAFLTVKHENDGVKSEEFDLVFGQRRKSGRARLKGRPRIEEANVTQIEEIPVSPSESRALVERLAASVELRRASRLRTFLLYVCEQSLSHGATVIHEQEVGTAIFGRSAGYDTGSDNIVRVNATELRKRLEHYFVEEGAAEEIVLEIQRGSYAPVFRRRVPALPVSRAKGAGAEISAPQSAFADMTSPSTETLTKSPEQPRAEVVLADPVAISDVGKGKLMQWWGFVIVLLCVACVAMGWQLLVVTIKVEPWRREPALRSFWGNFFSSGTRTDILLADTSFAIAEDMMQRRIALNDYLDYQYKRFAEDPALTNIQRHDLLLVLERNTGSIADFRVGEQILSLNPSDPAHLSLMFAREYAPDEAKRNNLVLIGSRQSNPWVSLFADKLNFDLSYDAVQTRPFIVNRAPLPGESSSYPSSDGDRAGTGYAVIAYIPALSGQARALIIEGTDSQATGAAGDYLTNEDSMRTLEAKFPNRKIPYFEALLRTSQLNGTPLHGEVIAFRTHANR